MSATTTRRIVCVETEHPHRHILAVGIGTEGTHATERMTVSAVRSAIANGDGVLHRGIGHGRGRPREP